jgi:hypothetical protein
MKTIIRSLLDLGWAITDSLIDSSTSTTHKRPLPGHG